MSIIEHENREDEKPDDREQYWADRINGHFQKSVEEIVQAGLDLIEAKDELRGRFHRMVEERLHIPPRTMQRLMAIANHPTLADPTHGSHLPLSMRTLSELATLPPRIVEARIADGSITVDLERRDVAKFKPGHAEAAEAMHRAKMTPLLRLKEENEEYVRRIADLEEELASANAETDAQEEVGVGPSYQSGNTAEVKPALEVSEDEDEDEDAPDAKLSCRFALLDIKGGRHRLAKLVDAGHLIGFEISGFIDGVGNDDGVSIEFWACVQGAEFEFDDPIKPRGRPAKQSKAEEAAKENINETMWRDRWLADNPSRTAADYNEFVSDDHNSEYWQWRRSVGEAHVAAERAAWLIDHPGNPLPEHMCSLSEAETKEYDEWRNKRRLKAEGG
jgi:hypothetical protein